MRTETGASVPAGEMNGSAITEVVVSTVLIVMLLAVSAVVFQKRQIQPLRLKSPSLLTLFMLANVATITFITIMAVNAEV
jgi:hypothetical protein